MVVLDSGSSGARARGSATTRPRTVATSWRQPTTAAQAQAARNRLQGLNDTAEDRAHYASALSAGPDARSSLAIRDTRGNLVGGWNEPVIARERSAYINSLGQGLNNIGAGATPRNTGPGGGGGGGGRGGGGGGGGGGGSAGMTQAMMDWLANLLRSGTPAALDLPDYQQQAYRDFDPTMYNNNRAALAQAVGTDQNTINSSAQQLMSFLNSNYSNAYANPELGTGGPVLGSSAAEIAQLLRGQGVGPTQGQANVAAEGVRARQMAGDWRNAMYANEEQAQRNRLSNAQRAQTEQLLNLSNANNAYGLGITQAETQGRAAWQSAADQWNEQQRQIAYQTQLDEAKYNAEQQASYRNQVLQTLIGLIPQLGAGVTPPDMAALGLV